MRKLKRFSIFFHLGVEELKKSVTFASLFGRNGNKSEMRKGLYRLDPVGRQALEKFRDKFFEVL